MARRLLPALALAIGCTASAAVLAQAPGRTLTINVGNVRVAKGNIHVDICPQEKFLKDDCPWSGDAPARLGTTQVIVRDVPPGLYAAQAFHDENSNTKVDRALFGIPKEGVGFSNDARISFGPPSWKNAVFGYHVPQATITFKLRYFLGPSGPPAAK
ncbi:hypothetical protein NSE01_34270 [Novosphingobium sediminis]|uniref:DUF2141 domain-containing protein n=1 Tax=Novosphingobium sediminis TaxID=707214 RepID=A0A512APG3_9SPHN|nr:DUF2141 domain-containing protein [Novosphingobium sediminis]GEO01595.1 hypothetical protein NSE01_34270 [Novosphingobium sediminis]